MRGREGKVCEVGRERGKCVRVGGREGKVCEGGRERGEGV